MGHSDLIIKERINKMTYNQDREIFKCRNCGCNFFNEFCATKDIGLCGWCGDEEEVMEN